MTQTFIYAIYNKTKNEVKIGYSTTPAKRLSQLQTGNSDRLELLCTFKGSAKIEAEIHERLHQDRLIGEWFRMSSSVSYVLSEYNFASLQSIVADIPKVFEQDLLKIYNEFISSSKTKKRTRAPLKYLVEAFPNYTRKQVIASLKSSSSFIILPNTDGNGIYVSKQTSVA
jgi:hypothetical protein